MYLSAREIAKKWNMSERRARILCMTKRIPGAFLSGYQWFVPVETVKPVDGRRKKAENPIEAIENKKKRSDACRPLTAGEADRLAEDFAVEHVFNSGAISGNALTLRETYLVLRGLTVGDKSLKDHIEAIGLREAFGFIRKKAEEKPPLTEGLIKQIHAFIPADKKDGGVYRRLPAHAIRSKMVPVPPAEIEERIKRAIDVYQNGTEHIVSRLARFHLEFETIRPFADGNGRTGRLITNFELMKAGFPPIDISVSDQKAYRNAFDAYAEKRNVSAMEDLFIRCLNESPDFRLKIFGE